MVSAVNSVDLVSPEKEADGLEDSAPDTLDHGGAHQPGEGRGSEEQFLTAQEFGYGPLVEERQAARPVLRSGSKICFSQLTDDSPESTHRDCRWCGRERISRLKFYF